MASVEGAKGRRLRLVRKLKPSAVVDDPSVDKLEGVTSESASVVLSLGRFTMRRLAPGRELGVTSVSSVSSLFSETSEASVVENLVRD